MTQIEIPVEWHREARNMMNGDVVLPAAFAFVLKKVSKVDSIDNTVDIAATLIIRIKLTGHVSDALKEYLKSKLRLRIN